MSSRPNDLIPSDNSVKEAKDKRSKGGVVIPGKDPQTEDDYFVKNKNPLETHEKRDADMKNISQVRCIERS